MTDTFDHDGGEILTLAQIMTLAAKCKCKIAFECNRVIIYPPAKSYTPGKASGYQAIGKGYNRCIISHLKGSEMEKLKAMCLDTVYNGNEPDKSEEEEDEDSN